jgi:opacity protein-like surface antigen
MKRKLIFLSTIVLTSFSLAGISRAQSKFSIKLTGGYGTMVTGDINAVLEGQEDLLSYHASLTGATKEGEFRKLNRGFEYEGEFILNLTEYFGLGIGVSYIQRGETSKVIYELEDHGYFLITFSPRPEIKAIPIKLTAYYFHPITSRLDLYLNGGIGYYIGKINYRQEEQQIISSPGLIADIKSETEIKAEDNALGFHGGIGFEYDVIKNFAFFAEGTGRYAKLKDWKGDEKHTATLVTPRIFSGILWFYEGLHGGDSMKYYPVLVVRKEKPVHSNLRNIRKAEGNFSGFSLRIGFEVKF